MLNLSQKPLASSKTPNQDLTHMVHVFFFKIKIDSQNLEVFFTKDLDHIQIKIRMPHPIHEPPVSSKAPTDDLNDMDALCTLKIKIES